MVGGARGVEEFLRPARGLEALCARDDGRGGDRNRGRGVEVAIVGGSADRGAEVGELAIEPLVHVMLALAVGPPREHLGRARRVVAGMQRPRAADVRGLGELFLGELADRLQQRVAGMTRQTVGVDERLAYERLEHVQHAVLVEPVTGDRDGGVEVEPTREDRASVQQVAFPVVEQVVGPLHRVAQRLVALEASS